MSQTIVIVGAGPILSSCAELIECKETVTVIVSPEPIPYRKLPELINVTIPFVAPYYHKNECKKGWRK